jgi:hypothetical protein
MKDSGLVRTGQPVSNLARGYQLKAGKPAPAELDVPLEILVGRHQRSLIQSFDPAHGHLMSKIPGLQAMRDKFR